MESKGIVRVFPRRTSYTPTDELTFVGDPPLLRPEADEVHVSVAFTWDIAAGKRLAEAWACYYPVVRIGGPAFGSECGSFAPGQYVREGITFTSRGCPNRCPWCLVPASEGDLRLLPIAPGHIIQDNNLLATPREHQFAVYAMLRGQRKAAVFAGGLDARLVDDWVARQLLQVRISQVFLAADTNGALASLEQAVKRLAYLGRNKLRCYVLCGFEGETMTQAEARLRAVWRMGCLPFAQLYQSPDRHIEYSREWRALARTWSRPAATKAIVGPLEQGVGEVRRFCTEAWILR